MSIYNDMWENIEFQRLTHIKLLHKYGKSWRESNDPLVQYITYDFNDDVPDYIGYPLYLTRYKSIYEKYKEKVKNITFNKNENG